MTTTPLPRRTLITGAAAVALAASLPAVSSTAAFAAPLRRPGSAFNNRTVVGWAKDTWHSLVAMTDAITGLPADNIPASLAAGDRSGYTSPTNIGGYLWSAVVAEELGLIRRAELVRRCQQTLKTLLRMKHHVPSGMYYNWYDEATGDVVNPSHDDSPVYPFASASTTAGLGPRCGWCATPSPRSASWPTACSPGCAGTCSTTQTPPTRACVPAG